MERTCFETYVDLCRPFPMDPPWSSLVQDRNCLAGPIVLDDALRTLTSCHSEEELLASKILHRNDEGKLVLHPFLSEPAVAVVALADPSSGKFNDLMTERGCVKADACPLFAAFDDRFTREAINRADGTIIITPDLPHAILLRHLGLPAVPIVGVSEFGKRDRLRYEQLYDFGYCPNEQETPKDVSAESGPADQMQNGNPLDEEEQPSESCQPMPVTEAQDGTFCADAPTSNSTPAGYEQVHLQRIVLMGWSPISRTQVRPNAIRRGLDHLLKLEECSEFNLSGLELWAPTAKSWEVMEYALKRQLMDLYQDALRKSAMNDYQKDFDLPTGKSKSQPVLGELAAAMASLHDARLDNSNTAERHQNRKEAEANYRRAYAKHVLLPMFERASTLIDPEDRAAQCHFAHLCELFDHQMLLVQEGMFWDQRGARDRGDKSYTQLLAISSQILAFLKDRSPWKTRDPEVGSRKRAADDPFVTIRRLGLDDQQLNLLRRGGYLERDRRWPAHDCHWLLRFRQHHALHTIHLGKDAELAGRVVRELTTLRATLSPRRELRRTVRQARQLMRETKYRLKQIGFATET